MMTGVPYVLGPLENLLPEASTMSTTQNTAAHSPCYELQSLGHFSESKPNSWTSSRLLYKNLNFISQY